MAPLPPIAQVYELTTFGTLHGKPCDHVVHWRVQAASGQELAACTSLAHNDVLRWLSTFGALLPTTYEHVNSRCVYLGDVTVPEAIAPATLFGGSSDPRLPAFSAVTIRHQSPVRGKGKDGRTNIPSPAASVMDPADDYSLLTTAVNQYNNAWGTYVSNMVANVKADLGLLTDPQVVIAHRKLGTYSVPQFSVVDPYLNTHRRWVKRLARHRRSA